MKEIFVDFIKGFALIAGTVLGFLLLVLGCIYLSKLSGVLIAIITGALFIFACILVGNLIRNR